MPCHHAPTTWTPALQQEILERALCLGGQLSQMAHWEREREQLEAEAARDHKVRQQGHHAVGLKHGDDVG